MSDRRISRRQALLAPSARPRPVPREELVNTIEFEAEARKTLTPAAFALIAGGDRAMFDRITLRPRMLVPTIDMDLSQTILGETHFVPIIVGPVSEQKQFHPDGELATAKGAAAARALMIVSGRSSVPIDQVAARAGSVWCQVYASDQAARTQIADGVKAGAKAIVITVGATPVTGRARPATASPIAWAAFDALRQRVSSVPVIVKGVSTAAEATTALTHHAQGIIVSNFGGRLSSADAPILEVPRIVDAVAGKVPVLVDGSVRRGTDVLKALAFGAQGVIVARPVMWGLAAYGDVGVQGVVEMLQTELARYMGMCGKSSLKVLDRSLVKLHKPAPARG